MSNFFQVGLETYTNPLAYEKLADHIHHLKSTLPFLIDSYFSGTCITPQGSIPIRKPNNYPEFRMINSKLQSYLKGDKDSELHTLELPNWDTTPEFAIWKTGALRAHNPMVGLCYLHNSLHLNINTKWISVLIALSMGVPIIQCVDFVKDNIAIFTDNSDVAKPPVCVFELMSVDEGRMVELTELFVPFISVVMGVFDPSDVFNILIASFNLTILRNITPVQSILLTKIWDTMEVRGIDLSSLRLAPTKYNPYTFVAVHIPSIMLSPDVMDIKDGYGMSPTMYIESKDDY